MLPAGAATAGTTDCCRALLGRRGPAARGGGRVLNVKIGRDQDSTRRSFLPGSRFSEVALTTDNFYVTPQWTRLRIHVLERDGYVCQIRGPKCRGRATQVDHIVPVADGGPPLDPANCRAACSWCNTWRAQRQKSRDGWKRAGTRIVLVVGPPGSEAEISAVIAERARPGDLIIDYRSIAAAIGDRHEEVRKVRGSLLTKLRRGEVSAPRAWITSTNPAAERMFPHHEVVQVGGRGDERWQARRAAAEAPATMREW